MRRTPLPQRTTPMPRGTKARISGALSGRNASRTGTAPIAARRKAPRETGFSQQARLLIRTRAGNGDPDQARCEATGVFLGAHGGEIQHRVARGMGGSRVRNNVANGVLLSCEAHRLAESRDEHMHAAGFWLLSSQDARSEPIMLHGADGGMTVWLDDEGSYRFQPPVVTA